MSLIRGLELPFGIKPIEATPVDAWSGPYISIEDALSSIPESIRYLTMQARITGEDDGSKIYWFKNGTTDEDLIPMIDMELQKGLTGETVNRISGDTALHNEITGETNNRILSDNLLNNNITALTKTVLDNYIQLTGETVNRIQSDNDINNIITILNSQLTGETSERIATDDFIYSNLTGLTQSFQETVDLFNTEVTARNIADNGLQSNIDNTNLRIDNVNSEIINIYSEISGGSGEFHDMVTGETAARITGDTELNDKIINLTNDVTGLTKTVLDDYILLNNSITAETANRIASDLILTGVSNGIINDISDLTNIVADNYEYNQNLIYTETFNRITGNTSLYSQITGETKNRQDADIILNNSITGETFNRENSVIFLHNEITGETKNRQDSDYILDLKIAEIEASVGIMSGDTSLYKLITGETADRISRDNELEMAIINASETSNINFSTINDSITGLTQIVDDNYVITNMLITGETNNRTIADIILNNSITALTETVNNNYDFLSDSITAETLSRISIDNNLDNRIGALEEEIGVMSGNTSLNDMITGETVARITSDINLNNQITGLTNVVEDHYTYNQGLINSEIQNRISEDTILNNQITGLSKTLVNDLIPNFSIHTGNTSVHITPQQNILLDGITGVTSAEINYLNGLTGNTQNQINNKSDLNHYHHSLYDQSGITEVIYIDAGKNLHIAGDLLISGTTYETHAETLYIKDNYIYLREGATAGLSNGSYTGIEAIKFDGVNNGRLVFDHTGTAKVGISGSEQPLLTRNDSTGMTDGHLTVWSSSQHRVNTIDPLTLPVSNSTLIKLSDEASARITGDTAIHNEITGETNNRIIADTLLNNGITAETFNRITGDTSLHNQITGLTSTVNDYYSYNQGLINSEIQNRISGDTALHNEITGETKNRQDYDIILSNSITAETFNRITGNTSLYNQITGETFNRVTGNTSLYNQITGETKNRQDSDIVLNNTLTGLTANFNQHSGNTNVHLSSSQNILLDGITGVTYSEINYLNGLVGNAQSQINTKSNTGHTHSAIYHPTGSTKIVYVDEIGDVHIDGDIYQTGTTYSTHVEEIFTKNNYIVLRDGATTALYENEYAGIEAVKYDGENNGRLVFDNTGIARVGDVGQEQPLVTRDEISGMTDGDLTYWSSNDAKIKSSGYNINNISNTFINVTGDTMTGDLISTAFIKSGATSGDFLKGDGSVDSTVYEPILPVTPENPKSKFLNGNRIWSEIAVGGKGYTTNLYLSNEDSDIIGYKKISSTYDPNQILNTITVRNDLGEVLGETFLYDEPIEVTHIDDGVWSGAFGTMVSSSVDNTVVKIVCFVKTTGGTENVLFTGYTDTIENTSMEMLYSENKQRNFTVNPSDRLGIRVYGFTDSSSIRTITYGIGGIYSSYFNTPLAIRHTNLRGLNNDPDYQHITISEKAEIVTTGRTINAGPGMSGGGNLSGDITISHADTSNASDLSAMANFNGIVVQDIEVKLDTYGHVTGHTVYNYDLDNRYYTEAESDNRFINVTGGTINGDIEANNANINSVTYKSGVTPTLVPGMRRLNTEMGTTELKLVGHDITLQDGFEMLGWGYNDSDNEIPNGCPITSTGNTITITGATTIFPAIASDADNILYRVAGVTTEAIPAHSYGIFCIIGEVHDLDLSTFDVGEDIFLSQTEEGKFVGKENLNISGRISEIGRVLNNSSTDGVLYIQIKNEFGVSNNTQLELETFAANGISTGVFYCEGISIPSKTGTTFNVGATKGWIVNNETNPLKPHVKYVEYTATTGLTTTFLNTNTITYILLKEDGTLYLSPSFPTPIERRQMIFIGNVGHANKSNISTAVNNIDVMISPFSQTRDILSMIPVINHGIYSSANGANLYINTSGGYLYSFGINFHNNPSDPTKLFITGSTQSWFAYRTSTGGTSNMTQTVDPGNYELSGTITSLSNKNYFTNQRIYMIRDGEMRIQYGQKVYNTIDAAINAISTESFITFEALRNDAILIGVLTVKGNTSNLSDIVQARFTQVSRFGEVAGAAGGISVSTLQGAYTNGSNPEIITNATLGALTVKRGSFNDSDMVLEIQNGIGTTTASINGYGAITGSSFTVSGGSANQFLKADGSLDSNLYLTSDNSGHTHEDLYYNKVLSDVRFVNVTGDTMSGDFRITGATPITDNTILIQDTNSTAILKGINTGDQNLSGLATYSYVDNTFSRTGHTHTGIYQPIMGSDDNYVTDIEKVKLNNLSGINTGDQNLSGYLTISAATTTYSPTAHTHDNRYYTKTQSDDRFVNITGDTITGELIATKFTKIDGTSSQFLMADGSSNNNVYYNQSTADTRFVNVTGDTMNGNFIINGNLSVKDITGGTILGGINTGDEDLSGLATYDYVDTTFSPIGHKHSSLYNPNGTGPTVFTDNSGAFHVEGNLYVSGSTYSTASETLNISDAYVKLRDGALGGLGTGEFSGFEVINYDGINNGRLVIDNTGTARVGDVGSEQPLATRNEISGMTDGGIVYWSSSEQNLKTTTDKFINKTGDTMSGTLTANSFVKSGSSDEYLLLAGGGIVAKTEFQVTLGPDQNYVTDNQLINIENLSGVNTGDEDLSGLATYDYVDQTFSTTGHTHDGIYEPLKGLNDNYVTDSQLVNVQNLSGVNTGDETASTIKTKLGITTLSGANTGDETASTIKTKLGITILSGDNTGDEDLSGLATYDYVDATFSTTGHTHIPEYDLRYVNVTGDTMTGSLAATSFIKTSGTASQFLKADGSSDSNSYSLSNHLHDTRYSLTGHTHDDRYYTETESDARFVNATGDTISGKLNITSGGISVTGVTTGTTIFSDASGNVVLAGKNTGDQDLSGLSTYSYVNNTFSTTGHTHTGIYEPLKSSNDNYVTDAQLVNIQNLSGVNTGDETASTIKTKLGITTLSGANTGDETATTIKTKLGITVLSGDNTGDEDLSGLATYGYVDQTFSTTGHTHIPEYDLRYVNVTGDTMTGSLTAASFIKNGSSNNEILLGGGGVKNVSNYNTAYNYSQIGHLPLSGGTVTGNSNFTGNLSMNGNIIQNYISSRGENLISNGSGLLGNNTNFSQLTFDGSNAYYSTGSFTGSFTGGVLKNTDEMFPVEIEQTYNCTFNAKSKLGTGIFWFMPIFYDVDNLSILSNHHMYQAGTTTTLAKDLKPGDTNVYLTSSTNWYNNGTDGFANYLRSFIFWDYSNSFGYTYPAETYSRNYYSGMWVPGAISGNIIALKTPWVGSTKIAGTKISNGNFGSSYKYIALVNNTISTEWTSYSGTISGVDLSGQNVLYKFVPGTAKCRIGWLWNYNSAPGEQAWFTNLAFSKQFNNNGGKIDGSVTANSFAKAGGTSNQFLKADGSVDSNIYVSSLTSGHTHDNLYYTKTISDSKYATLSGSTFTGSITATNLSGTNTGDEDLSGLATYDYVNNTFSVTGHNHDNAYVNVGGDTMTGVLNGTSAVFSSTIQATTGKFTNLTDGYLPYNLPYSSGLGNSPIYTNGAANVGIGTTNLLSKLHVNKVITGSSENWVLTLQNNNDSDIQKPTVGLLFSAGDTLSNKGGIVFQRTHSYGVGNMYFLNDSNGDPRTPTISGSTILALMSSGNVLIGTTGDTGHKLSVNGTGYFTGVLTASNLSGTNTGDEDLSGLATYTYVDNTFSKTGHTHDSLYVNVTGDTMTGSLTATSFVKTSGTASQFLKADGSSDSNVYSLSSHLHDDRYYTETESELRFINTTGDTMTGKLSISSGGISVTGVTTGATIFSDVSGNVVLSGKNTGDQDLSGLSTYSYVNNTFSVTGHNHDNAYINVTGDTMTGTLNGTNAIYSSTIQATTGKFTNLTDGYLPYHSSDSTGLTNSNIYTNGTNVGIGTATPSYTLDVSGATMIAGNIYKSSHSAFYTLDSNNAVRKFLGCEPIIDPSTSYFVYLQSPDNDLNDGIDFRNRAGDSLMRIYNGGNVLIGTTGDTGHKLNVSGTGRFTGTLIASNLSGTNTGDEDLSGLATYDYVDNTFSITGHNHYNLYTPNGVTQSLFVDSTGNVHVLNDLYLSGSTYNTNAETLNISSNYIFLRDGATASLANGSYTGIEAVKYDGVNNGRLVFDNTGTARVGDVGQEQPLATRDEVSGMTSNGYVYWDSASGKLKTNSLTTTNLSSNYYTQSAADTRFINVTGDTMSGKLNITSGGISVTGVTTGTTIFSDASGNVVLSGKNTGDQDLSDLATYGYVDSTFLNVNTGGTVDGPVIMTTLTVNGYTIENSSQINDVISTTPIYSIDKTIGNGAFIDYLVINTLTNALRVGTLMVAWNLANDSITYTDISIPDLMVSTDEIKLSAIINGDDVQIISNITNGSWNIKLGVRII